jgi:hypothetical protein
MLQRPLTLAVGPIVSVPLSFSTPKYGCDECMQVGHQYESTAGDTHSSTHCMGLCIARGVEPFVVATQGFRRRIRGGSRQVWT